MMRSNTRWLAGARACLWRAGHPARLAPMLAAATFMQGPAWAACQLQQMAIPVRIVEQRPIATLKLDGTEVPMLVDSGAFFSSLRASAATQLNLPLRRLPTDFRLYGHTGRIAAKLTRVRKVGLLDTELSNVDFIVGGNELGAGIMGVLGRNILSAADTEYDLAHGVVRLTIPKGDCRKTNLAYWAGTAPVIQAPLDSNPDDEDTSISLEVKVNGKKTIAMLDTGSTETLLTLGAARRAGIDERDLVAIGRTGGAGEGWAKSWLGPVASFELGGEKIADTRLRIDDVHQTSYGALVGLDYFLSHRIYVSRLQGQVYATWNGTPVFARSHQTSGGLDTSTAALPVEVDKDDADALARRGSAAMAAGNYLRALEDLNRACELAPGVADYFFARARLHRAMRKPDLARADLDQALRLDPALNEARLQRAAVRLQLQDAPGSQEDLATLDATLLPSAPRRREMAALYTLQDQVPQALRQYDLWVDSHPQDAGLADALNGRCWLRTRMNIDLPLALRDCLESVKKDDGSAHAHDSLGWTYLRLGEPALAIKAFDLGLGIQPVAESLYGRGLAWQRLNDTEKAQRDLEQARKLDPGVDEALRKQGFEFVKAVERATVPGS